jgi:hypothetical protein
MSTPEPGHTSPAVSEYRIQLLELELAQEKRDHDETRRQLSSANRKIEGFEKQSATLAARIDELEGGGGKRDHQEGRNAGGGQ